ncbi:uncharacterized protein LOC143845479 isoform X2 [Tasmannia lanceolata]|uniref:uncharacterized protein LOC143845479 isoform X2 n=1 Tax=Tasmannia lanceolata TaxID=3420 RepID=UPI004064A462
MDHARKSLFSLPRTVFTLLFVDYLSGEVLVSLREGVLNLVFSQKKAKEKGVLVSIEGASLHKRRRRRKNCLEERGLTRVIDFVSSLNGICGCVQSTSKSKLKKNDMMLVIFLSSLIRSVIALHNLINNRVMLFLMISMLNF